MRFNTKRLIMVGVCAMMAGMVLAADPQPTGEQPMGMPEMGPPAEMKQLAFLEGTWDVASKFNMSMDPAQEQWVESKATAVYTYICDGAAMQCTYSGDPMMPGMPAMMGLMLQTYDRESKMWQATWVDNMSGRISLYTGTHDGTTTVLTGEDKMGGMTWLTRITSYNETPTSFDWKMENSMDGGQTWAISGTSTYTKKP